MARHHHRRPTFPLGHRARRKPRRVPLVLRFIKGSIHRDILTPVLLHALFTTLVVYADACLAFQLHLPASITSSLSIVVGLLLVFRNQSSYYRFWSGLEHLTTICASVRNLSRSFLTDSYKFDGPEATPAQRADTEDAVRVLLAIVYAVKNTLRFEWGTAPGPQSLAAPAVPYTDENSDDDEAPRMLKSDIAALLPSNMRQAYEHQGLGLPIQLSVAIEAYIKRGHDRGWFHSPQASQLTVQVNQLICAYSAMETIRMTPIPVAYQIHTKQVLAVFCGVLPFAFIADLGWWTILIVSVITFTLYGIEGIASQLEDPFGYDRNDIKMDDVLEDMRIETEVMLHQWRVRGPMFATKQV